MQLTTTDFQKLTTEAGHDTPIVIEDADGTIREIRRVAFEQIHEIVPCGIGDAKATTEKSSTRLVIELS